MFRNQERIILFKVYIPDSELFLPADSHQVFITLVFIDNGVITTSAELSSSRVTDSNTIYKITLTAAEMNHDVIGFNCRIQYELGDVTNAFTDLETIYTLEEIKTLTISTG